MCNFAPKKPTMSDIPKGRTKDDIKIREKLIKDFLCPVDFGAS